MSSVTANNHNDNINHTIEKSLELALYTIQICKNKNVFNPDDDFNGSTTTLIVQLARDIYINAFNANKIDARKTSKDFEENIKDRVKLQRKCIQNCNDMYAMTFFAQKQFKFRSKRLKYWGSLIMEVKRLLIAWNESDVKRLL